MIYIYIVIYNTLKIKCRTANQLVALLGLCEASHHISLFCHFIQLDIGSSKYISHNILLFIMILIIVSLRVCFHSCLFIFLSVLFVCVCVISSFSPLSCMCLHLIVFIVLGCFLSLIPFPVHILSLFYQFCLCISDSVFIFYHQQSCIPYSFM